MQEKSCFNMFSNLEMLVAYEKMDNLLFNKEAVFSDETEFFSSVVNDEYNIKLRVGNDSFNELTVIFNNHEFIMEKYRTVNLFEYYKVEFKTEDDEGNYYFRIKKGENIFYYDKRGVIDENLWKIDIENCFFINSNFIVPKWSKGAIMYQIYIDRFYNGDISNDVKSMEYMYLNKPAIKSDSWDAPVEAEDIRTFYGGDIKGVMEKMGYLKELGVEAIYFNPLFVSPSNHKYDTQDYDYIDPHVGVIVDDGGDVLSAEDVNNEKATMYVKRTTSKENLEASNLLFAQMVELAHSNGIKVILDGVFNHCGAFNKWLDREGIYKNAQGYPSGAYFENNSLYNKYFKWKSLNWPCNEDYECWWGHKNHPKLNYEDSKELYNYILEVGAKWVAPPYNADGWRLDVAADLGGSVETNKSFWKSFRDSVKKANPEAIIIAEHYGDPRPWLDGSMWDTIMNYDGFMDPISYFLTGMEKHSENFRGDLISNSEVLYESLSNFMNKININSIQTSMNQLSNHDHSRFLTRTNMTEGRLHTKGSEAAMLNINKDVFKEGIVFQMTWPGSPTIYYGDEVGLCGWADPDNRRTFPWGKEDKDLFIFHKTLISIRKKYPVIKNGSVIILNKDEYGIFTYGRFDFDDKIIVAINNNDNEKFVKIPVWKAGVDTDGVMYNIFSSKECSFEINDRQIEVKEGYVNILIPSFCALILSEKMR